MYCKRCYKPLEPSADPARCAQCGRKFDPVKPRSYLERPFPSRAMIVRQVVLTTLVGVLAAFCVAFFQMARASGH